MIERLMNLIDLLSACKLCILVYDVGANSTEGYAPWVPSY